MNHAVLSHVGMRRATNQDSYGVHLAESQAGWDRHGHFFLVADGMGAHAAGELASKLASQLVPHNYLRQRDLPPAEGLHKAIVETNAEIYRRGQANIEFRSMGTTCSVLTLLPEGAVVAHVGDSRVYQTNGNKLYQLTFDHSLVWEMQAAGEVTDETARSGVIPKNVITRSLGPNANVQVDIEGPFPIRKGNCFLLCSDGLSGQVSDEEIGAILNTLPPEEACQLFVDLSNLRGGPDNITAVVVAVADDRIGSTKQDSIIVRHSSSPRTFSPALAVVSGVCLLAAVVLVFMQFYPWAIVSTVLGLIALLTGLSQYLRPNTSTVLPESRYGNGPYRQFPAECSQPFFEHLAGIMKSLREAAEEKNWEVGWDEINRQFKQACEKGDKGDWTSAVGIQSRIIISLMDQIRSQRSPNASDSSVDL
ncbi:MAG: protein phosphatase 2C domain-containing protein [Planctomycetales bacterium]|nr:protein phosphatase 2C domain-containing protein [Planctomycetales bacterium]